MEHVSGPALKSGLQVQDIVISIYKIRVSNNDEFVDAVKREGVRAGSILELEVLRGGVPIDIIYLEVGAADTPQAKVRALRIMSAVQDEDPDVALLKSAGTTVGLEVECHRERTFLCSG